MTFKDALATLTAQPAFTPTNLVLLLVLFILLYSHFKAPSPPSMTKGSPPTVFRTFTPTVLQAYSGKDGGSVYLALAGQVFDVTPGKGFYGPGGPYENFAGRDASRGLACQSFDEEMLTKDLHGPLDDLKDLSDEQCDNLRSWQERFQQKYLVVGKLVAESDAEAANN